MTTTMSHPKAKTDSAEISAMCNKTSRIPLSVQSLFLQCNLDEPTVDNHEEQPQEAPQSLAPETSPSTASPRPSTCTSTCSLHDFLVQLLEERGYMALPTYDTLKTSYYSPPTAWQLASHGPKVAEMLKTNDVVGMCEALSLAGLSPNPCNSYGESLVHMACRRGHVVLLQLMVDAGASLQICDDYGRTPLHDACWAAQPAFDIVKRLTLDCDRAMWFLRDTRGSLPLSYVHKDHEAEWKSWMEANIDAMFPALSTNGEDACQTVIQEMARQLFPSDDIPPPPQDGGHVVVVKKPVESANVSLELIKMVANGKMTPSEARLMADDMARQREAEEDEATMEESQTTDYNDDEDWTEYDESYYSSSHYDNDFDESEEEELEVLENELVEMLRGIAY